jgi:hypothetical protein
MSVQPALKDSAPLRIQAGGTLNPRQHIYIPRPEDNELLKLLVDGQYANVLTSRQTGKSSLVISTIYELHDRGVRTAYVDLASIGTPEEVEGYYKGLLGKIARDLKLGINVEDWWQGIGGETINQQLMRFFHDVVAGAADSPAVVFLDEIDSTLKLDFTDDLFTALRAMYNERALVPAYERVAFCLVGVATPNELIKDRRTTAYNVGRTLELRDFDSRCDYLAPLARALSGESGTGNAMLARVLHWTDGHPYLTMRVTLGMIERGARSADDVDRLIEEAFQTLDRVSSDVYFEHILRFIETRLHERERLAALGVTITVDEERSGNVAYFRYVSQEAFEEAVPLLKAVEPIVSLTLRSARVSDISALRGSILLRELDLRGTPVTAEAVARLRESLAAGGNRGVRITRGGILAGAVDNLYLAGRAWLRRLWRF